MSQQAANQPPRNTPDFIVYSVQERDRGQKPIWTRLGVAFKHKDGEGLNLTLQALPINFDGKLVAMPPKDGEGSESLAA